MSTQIANAKIMKKLQILSTNLQRKKEAHVWVYTQDGQLANSHEENSRWLVHSKNTKDGICSVVWVYTKDGQLSNHKVLDTIWTQNCWNIAPVLGFGCRYLKQCWPFCLAMVFLTKTNLSLADTEIDPRSGRGLSNWNDSISTEHPAISVCGCTNQ